VPEGAIPKDGPSAGITIATALVSALVKAPVKHQLAMTGEITLRGRILPIGGLTEKLLAARRGNITNVLVPKDNERDLNDVPVKIKKSLDIKLVNHMDEVLNQALVTKDGKSLLVN
jgi:ATP-dependent Lon protease